MAQSAPREIFVSYSRKNKDFALTLVDELQKRGRAAWIDLDAIPPSAEWWAEIKRGIDEAHTFVPILTPESLSSPVCTFEMDYAVKNNKRIIPLVRSDAVKAQSLGNIAAIEPTGFLAEILGEADLLDIARDNWRIVEKLNWIFIRDSDDFAQAFERFLYALDTDLDRVRLHTRLLTRARDWIERGRDDAYLLVGSDLRDASSWLKVYGDHQPQATPDQRALIEASVMHEQQAIATEARRQRTLRQLIAALSVVGILVLIIGIFALVQVDTAQRQAQIAVTAILNAAAADTRVAQANATLTPISAAIATGEQRVREGVARIESQRLAAEAVNLLNTNGGNAETAALLGIRALRITYTAQADAALVRAVDRLATVGVLNPRAGAVRSAGYSPDGRYIVTASWDGTARVWDATAGEEIHILSGHTDDVTSARYSSDGRYMVTASADMTVRVWDAATGEEVRVLSSRTGDVRSARYSPDGRYIVTASWDGTARVWDATTGEEGRILIHTHPVWSTGYSPDGMYIVTGSYDGMARVWDAATGEEVRVLSGHTNQVWSAGYSLDGRYIVTASIDRTVRVWDAATAETVRVLSGHTEAVQSAEYSPDGRYIVTASNDRTARVWDAVTSEEVRTLTGHTEAVQSAEYSPDGRYIVTASWDGTVRVWDVATAETVRVLSGHTNQVESAEYSPDGLYIVTAGDDRTARVWDAATGEEVRVLRHTRHVRSAEYSPDGVNIVTVSDDRTVRAWNAATGEEVRILRHTRPVFSAGYSPDGVYIVTASDDGTARVWDAATGEEVRVLSGHTGDVWSVGYSLDGLYIVTASNDFTARVWDADYRDFITYACARVLYDMRDDLRIRYGITDDEPTCPQFADDDTPMLTPFPLTSTGIPMTVIPVWTPIASPTSTP